MKYEQIKYIRIISISNVKKKKTKVVTKQKFTRQESEQQQRNSVTNFSAPRRQRFSAKITQVYYQI